MPDKNKYIEEFDELHSRSAWHEINCPAHSNQMQSEDDCTCLYGFIGDKVRDLFIKALTAHEAEVRRDEREKTLKSVLSNVNDETQENVEDALALIENKEEPKEGDANFCYGEKHYNCRGTICESVLENKDN